jgi:hypothetical protein
MYKYSEIEGESCIVDQHGRVLKNYGTASETMELVASAQIRKIAESLKTEGEAIKIDESITAESFSVLQDAESPSEPESVDSSADEINDY